VHNDTTPTADDQARVLDKGSLRQPVPPHPLAEQMDTAQTDYFRTIPAGIDARWEQVDTPLFQRSFTLFGKPGSGKSTLAKTLLAGAVLDPLVETEAWVFAVNNDWEWCRGVASVHVGGDEDDVTEAIARLRELLAELRTRGLALQEHGIDKVTRTAAERDVRLRPRVVVMDECQKLFKQEDKQLRDEVKMAAEKLLAEGRKYAVTVLFATPDPGAGNVPREVVMAATNKATGAIGDQRRNDIALYDGAFAAGLSAVGLQPAITTADGTFHPRDIGTLVQTGYGSGDGLLRTYVLSDDQLAAVARRAAELRDGRPGRR